jgi:hypothetical protein
MSKVIYRGLLWLHPALFRERFAGEMLWIFDETAPAEGAAALLADGLLSLMRQWLVRRITWKLAAAVMGGLLQVGLVAALTMNHGPKARAATGNFPRVAAAPAGALEPRASRAAPQGRTIPSSTPVHGEPLAFGILFGAVFVYTFQGHRLHPSRPRFTERRAWNRRRLESLRTPAQAQLRLKSSPASRP